MPRVLSSKINASHIPDGMESVSFEKKLHAK